MKTGKPGAGKSYGGVLELVEELAFGEKCFCTNLALNLWPLQMLMIKWNRPVDVFSRIRILDRDEAQEFWRYRTHFTVLPNEYQVKVDQAERAQKPVAFQKWRSCLDFTKLATSRCVEVMSELSEKLEHQVVYIIDEAHLLFDSRKYQQTAPELTFYNSQHRKLHDECIFITQFLGLIEKRVKGFAEEFHVYRNFAGASVLTFLAMPKRMREMVFTTEPTANMNHNEADRERWRALDRDIGAVYDTSRGVGIGGGKGAEDRSHRRLQLPWWAVFVGIAVGVWALTQGAKWYLHRGMSQLSLSQKAASVDTPKKPERVETAKKLPLTAPGSSPGETQDQARVLGYADHVWMTGSLISPGHVIVTLSDGRRLRDKDLMLVDEERAIDRYGWTYYRAPVVPPGGLSRSPDKSEGGKGAAVLVPARGMVSQREILPTKSANPGPAAPVPHPGAQSTALGPQAGKGMPRAGRPGKE